MNMQENSFKTFMRMTFRSGSPVPYLISGQVGVFVLIYLFDLLFELKIIPIPLFELAIAKLSLPHSFQEFILQPWSLLTYNFVYTGLFNLAFECLWLYWVSAIFFNFLNKRQFLFIYLGSILLSALIFLLFSTLNLVQQSNNPALFTGAYSLAAILAATTTLVPKYEMRLLLFGTVKLKTISIIYFALQFLFLIVSNKPAAIAYCCAVLFGIGFVYALKAGIDWSKIGKKKEQKKVKLKVVAGDNHKSQTRHQHDLPNQDEIDQILDKISLSGYDSLDTQEKETLFKLSNKK